MAARKAAKAVARIWFAAFALFSLLALGLAFAGHSKFKPVKEEWRVLPPLHYQNLHIFPIVPVPGMPMLSDKDYITLDEGLKNGTIEVTESGVEPSPIIRTRPPGGPRLQQQSQQVETRQQGFGGQVNTLWIINRSGRKLVLLAGELVVGGKQDRIVQKDMIVPPSKKPFDLSVFCVEQGRWSGGSANFSSYNASPNVGSAGGGLADPSVRGTAQAERRQEAVWAKVGEKNAQAGAAPSSGTYQGTLNSPKVQKDSKAYHDAIRPNMPKNAVGAVVAIHGQIVWVDAFRSADMFQKYWPKLLQSYVVDAMTTPAPMRPADERIPRVLRNPPSVEDAAKFLFDESGKSTFEGLENMYKVTRIEGDEHVIFKLYDLTINPDLMVHFNKMKKR